MLVHKHGTHFTTPHRFCDKYGYLDGHVCSLEHRLCMCRSSLACLSARLTQTPQLQVYPSTLLNVLFAFPLCSVYCNTLLANLNARGYIRGEMTIHNLNVDSSTTNLRVSSGFNIDQQQGKPESIQMSGKISRSGQVGRAVVNPDDDIPRQYNRNTTEAWNSAQCQPNPRTYELGGF